MGKAAAYMGMPFILLVSIVGGYYAGLWLDQKFGTTYCNVIGLVLGFALGLFEIVRQLNQMERKRGG